MGKGGLGSFLGPTGNCDSNRWEEEKGAQAQHAAPGNHVGVEHPPAASEGKPPGATTHE